MSGPILVGTELMYKVCVKENNYDFRLKKLSLATVNILLDLHLRRVDSTHAPQIGVSTP